MTNIIIFMLFLSFDHYWIITHRYHGVAAHIGPIEETRTNFRMTKIRDIVLLIKLLFPPQKTQQTFKCLHAHYRNTLLSSKYFLMFLHILNYIIFHFQICSGQKNLVRFWGPKFSKQMRGQYLMSSQ